MKYLIVVGPAALPADIGTLAADENGLYIETLADTDTGRRWTWREVVGRLMQPTAPEAIDWLTLARAAFEPLDLHHNIGIEMVGLSGEDRNSLVHSMARAMHSDYKRMAREAKPEFWHVMYTKAGEFYNENWPATLTFQEVEQRLRDAGATYWEIGR